MTRHDWLAFVAALRVLVDETTCKTPAYGAPGYAHCAACCYGTLIAATCQEEHDVAAAARDLLAAVERMEALSAEVTG